ncbi:hypothetical protein D3C78_1160850 [compost metagenome]
MRFGITPRNPQVSNVVDGGAVVAPCVAVVEQTIAERHAHARLEILRIIGRSEIAAATAADKPFISHAEHIIAGQRAIKLFFARALLAAIIQTD